MTSYKDKTFIGSQAGLLACAVVLCFALPARAESSNGAKPLTVVLEYIAAPDCPDVNDFRAIIDGRLGYDPFRDSAADHVLVQISSRSPAFEGRIEWRDAEGGWAGDRTFPSRTTECRDLARAMAFALALQIQLSAGSAPPPPGASEPAKTSHVSEAHVAQPTLPEPVLPPSKPPDAPAPSQAVESPPPASRAVLVVGAGASVGFEGSGAVPFGRVLGGLAWPHGSLELAAEVGMATTGQRADGAGFSQREMLAAVAGCGTLAPWSGCLVAKGGATRITGEHIEKPSSTLGAIIETGLRLAVTQPLGSRIYVAARAEGLIVITRWQVALDNAVVWTSSRFAGTLGLDVGVRFP